MAGLSQGSEAAVAASPKPAVAASPEDLASLRVSQPLKLSNVPLKWIRDSCEDPRGTPTTDCVVLSKGSEPAVAASQKVKAKRAKYIKQYMKQYDVKPDVKAKKAEYMKQYRARPEVKAKRAKYIKQCMKQYNVMPDVKAKRAKYINQTAHYCPGFKEAQRQQPAVAGERSTGFKTDAKTATRGGGGSKTATHP